MGEGMKYRIIKIHGCSGAGKTTIVRSLMACAIPGSVVAVEEGNKIIGYGLGLPGVDAPIFVIGSYENNCGGMDTVPSQDRAMELIDQFAAEGHVIHEGLLQSTYYGKMGEHSKKWGDDYIYAFLNTPVETCLERVLKRREENGSKNKFNPQLTIDKFNTIKRLKERVKAMGHNTYTFDSGVHPVTQIQSLLTKRGH